MASELQEQPTEEQDEETTVVVHSISIPHWVGQCIACLLISVAAFLVWTLLRHPSNIVIILVGALAAGVFFLLWDMFVHIKARLSKHQ